MFAEVAHVALLRTILPRPFVCVTNISELIEEAKTGGVIAFISFDRLPELHGTLLGIPIVAIANPSPAGMLGEAVVAFEAYPSLSHVMAASTLSGPRARAHVAMLVERLVTGPDPLMIGSQSVGRVALLACASRRNARFDRMRFFYEQQGLSMRAMGTLEEIADELVLNALYDAPAEAGYFAQPRQRTEDVELPSDRACEISYAVDREMAFVRVRDTFGALTRERLVEVLVRCNRAQVQLDASRGGAGLGLWRVFAAASIVNITVVPGVLTDILVGIEMPGRKSKLAAVHLFFEAAVGAPFHALLPDDEILDRSVTLVHVA